MGAVVPEGSVQVVLDAGVQVLFSTQQFVVIVDEHTSLPPIGVQQSILVAESLNQSLQLPFFIISVHLQAELQYL